MVGVVYVIRVVEVVKVIRVVGKGQEFTDFFNPGTSVSFPYIPAANSGTSGNRPVGPEILSFYVKGHTKSGLKQ